MTPAEELLETMSGLVRAGKIRYWGVSNTPAWVVAKLATLAQVRGLPGPVAQQFFYSLVNREVEDEHVPVGAEFGMGLVPWSPLAGGLLSGKYGPAAAVPGDGRLGGANPFGDRLFTDRNRRVVEALRRVAGEVGEPMARVALAWVVGRPGVATTLMGVSRVAQVADAVAALDLDLSPEHLAALDAASLPAEPRLLSGLSWEPLRRAAVFGGSDVRGFLA